MSNAPEESRSTTGVGITNLLSSPKVSDSQGILLPVQDTPEKKDADKNASKALKKQAKEARKLEKKAAKKEEKKIKKDEKKAAKQADKDAKQAKKEKVRKAKEERIATQRQKLQMVALSNQQRKISNGTGAKPPVVPQVAEELNFWGEGPPAKHVPPAKRPNSRSVESGDLFSSVYKMTMCKQYMEKGSCSKGKHCVHAHGWSEFRGKVRKVPKEDQDIEVPVWQVSDQVVAPVRSEPSFTAAVLGRKQPGTIVRGVRLGPWLQLVGEQGYIPFKNQAGKKVLVEEQTARVKEELVKEEQVKEEATFEHIGVQSDPIAWDSEKVWARFPGVGEAHGACQQAVLECDNGDGTVTVRWANGHEGDRVVLAESVFMVREFPVNPDLLGFEAHCIHCSDTGWLSEGEPCYCDLGQRQRDMEAERARILHWHSWVRVTLEPPPFHDEELPDSSTIQAPFGQYGYKNTCTGEVTKELPPILQGDWERRQIEPYGMIYFNIKTEQVHFKAPPIPEDAAEDADQALQSCEEHRSFQGATDEALAFQGKPADVRRFDEQGGQHIEATKQPALMDNASAIQFFEGIHAKAMADKDLTPEAAVEQIEKEVLQAKACIPAEMLQVMLEEVATLRNGG